MPGSSSGFSRVLHHPRGEEITSLISTASDFLCRADLCRVGANEANKCSLVAGGPAGHRGMQAPEHLRNNLGARQLRGAQASCGHKGIQNGGAAASISRPQL